MFILLGRDTSGKDGRAGCLPGKGGFTAEPRTGEGRPRLTPCSGGAGVRGYGLRRDSPAEARWDSRWILDVMPWTGKPYRYHDADRRAGSKGLPFGPCLGPSVERVVDGKFQAELLVVIRAYGGKAVSDGLKAGPLGDDAHIR